MPLETISRPCSGSSWDLYHKDSSASSLVFRYAAISKLKTLRDRGIPMIAEFVSRSQVVYFASYSIVCCGKRLTCGQRKPRCRSQRIEVRQNAGPRADRSVLRRALFRPVWLLYAGHCHERFSLFGKCNQFAPLLHHERSCGGRW